LSVVGYYQASDRLDDAALVPVGEKVASKVRDKFQDAVTFVVRLNYPLEMAARLKWLFKD